MTGTERSRGAAKIGLYGSASSSGLRLPLLGNHAACPLQARQNYLIIIDASKFQLQNAPEDYTGNKQGHSFSWHLAEVRKSKTYSRSLRGSGEHYRDSL